MVPAEVLPCWKCGPELFIPPRHMRATRRHAMKSHLVEAFCMRTAGELLQNTSAYTSGGITT